MSRNVGMFVTSVNTKKLYDRLVKMAQGDMVAYQELSALIGMDVRVGPGRSSLTSARRMAQRDDKSVFDSVRGKGLVRLDAGGIEGTGVRAIRGLHRSARRGKKRLDCIKREEYEALPNEQKVRLNTSRAVLGVFEQIGSTAGVRKMTERVANDKKIDATSTLEIASKI